MWACMYVETARGCVVVAAMQVSLWWPQCVCVCFFFFADGGAFVVDTLSRFHQPTFFPFKRPSRAHGCPAQLPTLLNGCERGGGRRPPPLKAVLCSSHTSYRGLQHGGRAGRATSIARAVLQTFLVLLVTCTVLALDVSALVNHSARRCEIPS